MDEKIISFWKNKIQETELVDKVNRFLNPQITETFRRVLQY